MNTVTALALHGARSSVRELDGALVDDPTGLGINYAGYVIHSAIHAARPDLQAVLHTHTRHGIAVSAAPMPAAKDRKWPYTGTPWCGNWSATISMASSKTPSSL